MKIFSLHKNHMFNLVKLNLILYHNNYNKIQILKSNLLQSSKYFVDLING